MSTIPAGSMSILLPLSRSATGDMDDGVLRGGIRFPLHALEAPPPSAQPPKQSAKGRGHRRHTPASILILLIAW